MFYYFRFTAAVAFGLSVLTQGPSAFANWETVSSVTVCGANSCGPGEQGIGNFYESNTDCININLNSRIVEHDTHEVWVYLSPRLSEARKILRPYRVSAPGIHGNVVCVTVESMRR